MRYEKKKKQTSLIFIIGSIVFLMFFMIKFGIFFPQNTEKHHPYRLCMGVPIHLTSDEENISRFSGNPIFSLSTTEGVVLSADKHLSNNQETIYALANESRSRVCSHEINILPGAVNESKIGINIISSTLALFGFEIQYPRIGVVTQYFLIFLATTSLMLLVFILMKFGILIPLRREKHRHVSLTVGVPFQLTC